MSDRLRINADFETHSELSLPQVGVWAYAEHESTDAWCLAYRIGDQGKPKLWWKGDPPPKDLFDALANGAILAGWNVAFEWVVWSLVMVRKHGWPALKLNQIEDTMARSAALAMPLQLAQAAHACGLDKKKDMQGQALMKKLAEPRYIDNQGKTTWRILEREKLMLGSYCQQDVLVEHALGTRLPPLTAREDQIWRIDQRINARGIRIDNALVDEALYLAGLEIERLDGEMREVTRGQVSGSTKVAELGQFALDYGYPMENLQADTIRKALRDPDLPETVRSAFSVRLESAKSSIAKYEAMRRGQSSDGRIRGLLRYHLASTGRWSSSLVQLHNLPRGIGDLGMAEAVNDVMSLGVEDLRVLYGSVLDLLSHCVRGALIADDGKLLVCFDWSQIEARILAWLAGQQDVLTLFENGEDVYTYAANNVGSSSRMLGKVLTLALGYQMGGGTFQESAEGYGVELTRDEAEHYKDAWRESNTEIVNYWYDTQTAAMNACLKPGKPFWEGHVCYRHSSGNLYALLPSGRKLCYPRARLEEDEQGRPQIRYWGIHQKTRKWDKLSTYGGKLVENQAQAIAADVLRDGLVAADAAQIPTVMHVHDEMVAEVEAEQAETTLELLTRIGNTRPSWMADCPLTGEGFITDRYYKG